MINGGNTEVVLIEAWLVRV